MPFALVLRGVEVLARMAWTFLGATAEGCAHRFSCASVRTRHRPGTIAGRRSDMAAQGLRSADRSSCLFTARRPRFGSGCVRHRSAIFLSKALRFDKRAAWHRARALRNTVWIRVSHPAASAWCRDLWSVVKEGASCSGRLCFHAFLVLP